MCANVFAGGSFMVRTLTRVPVHLEVIAIALDGGVRDEEVEMRVVLERGRGRFVRRVVEQPPEHLKRVGLGEQRGRHDVRELGRERLRLLVQVSQGPRQLVVHQRADGPFREAAPARRLCGAAASAARRPRGLRRYVQPSYRMTRYSSSSNSASAFDAKWAARSVNA